jgi:hypothetical protein
MTAFPAFKRKQVASGLLGLNVNQVHFEFAFRTQQDRLNGVSPIQRVVHGGDPLRLYFMRSEREAERKRCCAPTFRIAAGSVSLRSGFDRKA